MYYIFIFYKQSVYIVDEFQINSTALCAYMFQFLSLLRQHEYYPHIALSKCELN